MFLAKCSLPAAFMTSHRHGEVLELKTVKPLSCSKEQVLSRSLELKEKTQAINYHATEFSTYSLTDTVYNMK